MPRGGHGADRTAEGLVALTASDYPRGCGRPAIARASRTLGYASTVALVAGVIGAGVGGVLLLLPPSRAEAPRAVRVTPHVGLGSAGVSGSF
ncbi:MAG: hypothetical protein JWP87_5579 [Labilithrix sp.]|nr:hypothetical protein [Labilithrix sp.]